MHHIPDLHTHHYSHQVTKVPHYVNRLVTYDTPFSTLNHHLVPGFMMLILPI
jgi:hypothetical protein